MATVGSVSPFKKKSSPVKFWAALPLLAKVGIIGGGIAAISGLSKRRKAKRAQRAAERRRLQREKEWESIQYNNPYAGLKNPYAGLKNPYADLKNPYANLKNPYANLKNPYANLKNQFADMKNPYAGLENVAEDLTVDTQAADYMRTQRNNSKQMLCRDYVGQQELLVLLR